jgi:hypothetical protein
MAEVLSYDLFIHAEDAENPPGDRAQGKGKLSRDDAEGGFDAAQGRVFDVVACLRRADS